MSKQDIEKRLGFAAQGVKAEMAIGSYKQGDRTVTVNGKKYEVLPYQMDFFIKELATLDTPEWRADVVKEYLRRGYIKATAARPGVKAKMAKGWSGTSTKLNRYGDFAVVAASDDGFPKSFSNRTQAQAFSDKHNLGGVKHPSSGGPFYVYMQAPKDSESTNASRPGVKAKFATEVGRKGNKSAMISRDATGTWYAYVVQRIETGIGKDEDMLGTMRAYSTEDRAKRAAIKALDTSGFSRPGVKAKMGRAEKVLSDGSVSLDFTEAKEWLSTVSDEALKYIISDSNAAAKAMGSGGKKFNYYTDLALTAAQMLRSTKRGGHRLNSSRPSAKAKMENSDGNYFMISGYVDNSILGNRTFDTQAEAEYYGKRMLESLKKDNPKAKDVNVQISKVIKYSPQTPFKTLSLRPGAKAKA